MGLSDVDRRIVWVRAGGRCVLCTKYLLEGQITWKEYPLGEAAHIVGQTDSERSPRGEDDLAVDQRDTPDNVLLACPDCHSEIDKLINEKIIDVEFLRARKKEREDQVRRLTGMVDSTRSAVLRLVGDIRGNRTSLSIDEAVLAMIRHGRIPHFLSAYDNASEEIDLRGFVGEGTPTQAYYEQARDKVDEVIDNRIAKAIAREEVTHLSVFALARLPLLVYFGSRIDDAVAVEVYQRHRTTQSWVWPATDPGTTFGVALAREGTAGSDVVLLTNLSGSTPLDELPETLRDATVFVLAPSMEAAEDVIGHPEVLARFTETVRSFFTGLEVTHKSTGAVHLIGALPASPAVEFGRALKSGGIRPRLVTYDRTDGGYVEAIVI